MAASSEGRVYSGDLPNGHWVDAACLQPGDRLLNDDATWAEVVAVGVEARPLIAYNLTVADFHTYFVAATANAAPVWVHNNCWDVVPDGAAPTGRRTAFGQDIYKFDDGTEIDHGHDARFYNARVYPPTAGPIRARVAINRQNGLEFERKVLASSQFGGVKNTTPITVTLSNGTVVTTIPDLWNRTEGGLLEAKNVVDLPNSNQLRAQVDIAIATQQPMKLIVSQRTQSISQPVIDSVRSTGGDVYIYDPVNDTVRPWKK